MAFNTRTNSKIRMCGLILQYNKTGRNFPPFATMLNEMAHRGTDAVSIDTYQTCRVGFRRLAITDIETQQPGRVNGWICYVNGEIYNYKDLGFPGTECEVLCQGFAKYGIAFVSRLNGMFAGVAIQGENVYVFRDRFGEKPMYYFETLNSIVLASECKALIKHPDYRFAVNESAQKQLLTFNNIFTNETLFDGIYRMSKGSFWHLATRYKVKYWQWNFEPEPMDYEEAKREVRRLVERSVAMQTPKEVSYGACLSGGLDSSIIVALSGDLPTFTVGYKGQEDERLLAEVMGRQQREIVFDQVRDFEETISSLENPLLGASWMHVELYRLVSKYVKVLFDGAGADELFGGYQWRYTEPDYWNVVNRTGIDDPYCREVFAQIFPEDTPAKRYRFDAEHFLGGVLSVVDKLSMSQTIEVRTPFLENDLVDFACKIPFEYKKDKQILRDAFSDVLPPEISHGKKKGFTTPKDWIPGEGNQAKRWIESALAEWEKCFNFEL